MSARSGEGPVLVVAEALQEADEVGEVLMTQAGFEPLGHEGKFAAGEGFDVASGQMVIGAVEEAQGEVVGVFRKNATVESGAVGESDGVTSVGRIDRLIGI